jgi:hypothetical protein
MDTILDNRLARALFVFGLFGFLSVLLDLDHLISLLVYGRMARSAHIGSVITVWFVCLVVNAHLVGLSSKVR